MKEINWNKIIDGLTVFMIGVVLMILAICTLILLFFDGLVGTGAMMVFTNKHELWSAFISLATTGMAVGLAFMAYLANKWRYGKIGGLFALCAFGVACIDVYFDSLTADYFRYGGFIIISNLPLEDRVNHILFRALIGGMSVIGEPLAVAIVAGMPDLKIFIRNVIPSFQQQYGYSVPAADVDYDAERWRQQRVIERLNSQRRPYSRESEALAREYESIFADENAATLRRKAHGMRYNLEQKREKV